MGYRIDDSKDRIDRDAVWALLREVYWAKWRSRADVETQIDDGPGAHFRWTLFTSDAHGLYEQFGFTDPGPTALVRPAAQLPVHPTQVPTA